MYSLASFEYRDLLTEALVKPIHPILVIAGFAALGTCANPVFAGTGCQDDPEHCVERGVSTSHRSVAVAQAPAPTLASAPGRAAAVVATRRAPVPHKPASKPSRVAPST